MPPLPDGLPQLQNQINLSYSLFASASPSKFGQVVLRKTTFPDSTLRCTYLCEISGLDRGCGGLVSELLVEGGELAAKRHPKRALVALVEPRALDRVQAEFAGHVGPPSDRLEQGREAVSEVGLEHRRIVGVDGDVQAG